ncbi:MAG: PPC domain-containing protein [Anaerolineales bacterium]|jgi:hypothetical protein
MEFGLGAGLFTLALSGILFLTNLYMVYKLYQEKGLGHAILGFFFPIYPYFWGWLNASRLKLFDIMIFWTVLSIGTVVFPLAMGFRLATLLPESGGVAQIQSFSNYDISNRGPLAVGSTVQGRIDGMFDMDSWTFQGSAGQTVTISADPAAGQSTDPQIHLTHNGEILVTDDDSGNGYSSLIANYRLPASGTYIIYVEIWSAGGYVLTLR